VKDADPDFIGAGGQRNSSWLNMNNPYMKYRFINLVKNWWPLGLVLLLAILIRVVNLGTLPATFFDDEVLSGYLGRYLWETGTDLYGNPWPLLYFNKFGDYYIILPMYLDGLSTYLFGMTWFATRLPTAIIGALAVVPVAIMAFWTFYSRKIAWLAGLFVAIAPWHIVLSRATTESVLEMTVILTSVVFLIYGWRKRKSKWVVLSLLFALLAYFTYHTARIIMPLLWLGGLVFFWTQIKNSRWLKIISIGGLLTLMIVTLVIASTPWGKGRFEQTSIFGEQSGVAARNQELIYGLGNSSILTARIFHNKLTAFGRAYITQYMSYFSPLFLWTDQGWSGTRYAVPQAGPLLLTMGLLLLTLLIPIKKPIPKDQKMFWLLLWMLAIAVVPASLTIIESPSVRRSVLMVAPITILAAYAFYRTWWMRIGRLPITVILTVILLLEIINFGFLYARQSDTFSSFHRSDGLTQLAEFLVKESPTYDEIVVPNRQTLPIYYLFSQKDFDPSWGERFGFNFTIDKMDNVTFLDSDCPTERIDLATSSAYLNKKVIFIAPKHCQFDQRYYSPTSQITGINPLLGFQIFEPIGITRVQAAFE